MVDSLLTRNDDVRIPLLLLQRTIHQLIGWLVLNITRAIYDELSTPLILSLPPPWLINQKWEMVTLPITQRQFNNTIILVHLLGGIIVRTRVRVQSMLSTPIESIYKQSHVDSFVETIIEILMWSHGRQFEDIFRLLMIIQHLNVDAFGKRVIDLEWSFDEDLESMLRTLILHHSNHQELVIPGQHLECLDRTWLNILCVLYGLQTQQFIYTQGIGELIALLEAETECCLHVTNRERCLMIHLVRRLRRHHWLSAQRLILQCYHDNLVRHVEEHHRRRHHQDLGVGQFIQLHWCEHLDLLGNMNLRFDSVHINIIDLKRFPTWKHHSYLHTLL